MCTKVTRQICISYKACKNVSVDNFFFFFLNECFYTNKCSKDILAFLTLYPVVFRIFYENKYFHNYRKECVVS